MASISKSLHFYSKLPYSTRFYSAKAPSRLQVITAYKVGDMLLFSPPPSCSCSCSCSCSSS